MGSDSKQSRLVLNPLTDPEVLRLGVASLRQAVADLIAAWSVDDLEPHRGMLWDAVERGDEAAVRTMLEAGSDPNEWNEKGKTALMLAATAGHNALLTLLLEGIAWVTHRC